MFYFFQFSVLLGVTVTFLPSFLLAIIFTLDLTNKKSLSILISHPYLVLLPTFTFFSYAKNKICGDSRTSFSSKLSIVNMLLNVVVLPGIVILLGTIYDGFDVRTNLHIFGVFLLGIFPALFTLLFVYLEKISCCSCCGSAGRLVRVFDPEHPEKSLVLTEGRVVEVTGLVEDTEETVTNNTVDNIEDRREEEEEETLADTEVAVTNNTVDAADDKPDLETEEYRLEEERPRSGVCLQDDCKNYD